MIIDKGDPVAFSVGTPYLNPAAFSQVPRTSVNQVPLRLGSAPRYLPDARSPWYMTHDLSIQKQFRFTEDINFELRADAINAFNHPGRGNPVLDITSADFGKITGSGSVEGAAFRWRGVHVLTRGSSLAGGAPRNTGMPFCVSPRPLGI